MIQAQLYGKAASELTWSEDVLTSNIFGLLKYVSTPEVILSILQGSYNLDGESLQFERDVERISYRFWPRLNRSEPDLVILVHTSNGDHIIGVEAKYISGKSNVEDLTKDSDSKQRDQLAREIEDLYDTTNYPIIGVDEASVLSIRLIYLTLESYMPVEELHASLESVQLHALCPAFAPQDLYWLSWKSMYDNLRCESPSATDTLILHDLRSYLDRKNMRSFAGYTINPVNYLTWHYAKQVSKSLTAVAPITWNYKELEYGTE